MKNNFPVFLLPNVGSLVHTGIRELDRVGPSQEELRAVI